MGVDVGFGDGVVRGIDFQEDLGVFTGEGDNNTTTECLLLLHGYYISLPYGCIKKAEIFRNRSFGCRISNARRFVLFFLDLTLGEISFRPDHH